MGGKANLSQQLSLQEHCLEVLSLWVWVSEWAEGAGAGRAFSGSTRVEEELRAASEPLHQPMLIHSTLQCPTAALQKEGTCGDKAS